MNVIKERTDTQDQPTNPGVIIDGYLLSLYREVSEMSTIVKGTSDRIEAIENKMDVVANDLARYRGIVGGIMWIGGLLWAGLIFFKDYWR